MVGGIKKLEKFDDVLNESDLGFYIKSYWSPHKIKRTEDLLKCWQNGSPFSTCQTLKMINILSASQQTFDISSYVKALIP